MGVAVGDFDNDGFPDLFITCVGQSRLFRNTGQGTFVDVTRASGLGGREAFSTSAMWVDIDRDGHLDLFVCNYVRWSPEQRRVLQPRRQAEVVLHARGVSRRDLLAVPQPRQRHVRGHHGDGAASSTPSSKALGVALLDDDQDGWPDIFVANDTRAEQALSQPAQRQVQGRRACGRRGAQRRRQGARGHGRGRRRLRQQRPHSAWRSPTSKARWSGCIAPSSAGGYRDVATRRRRRPAVEESARLRLSLCGSRSRRRPRPGRRQRPHRRHRPQHSWQCRLRAAAAPVPERPRHVPRRRAAGRRRFRAAARRARPGVRRFRRRRRRRPADDDEQWARRAVSQRSAVGEPEPAAAPDRRRIESRRHRRDRAYHARRRHAVAHGATAGRATCRSPNCP